MAQDLYVVLGVSRDADLSQIRRAYRQLVKKYHPDIDRGTQAVERFLEIQRAYETLSDGEARSEYDRRSSPQAASPGVCVPVRRGEAMASQGRGVTRSARRDGELLFDAVDELFGGFVPGVFTSGGMTSPRKDLYVELVLDRNEAAAGGLYPLEVPVRFGCPACGGTGTRGLFLCPQCRGSTLGYRALEISMPPGVADGTRAALSLADLGLPDVNLNVLVSVRA